MLLIDEPVLCVHARMMLSKALLHDTMTLPRTYTIVCTDIISTVQQQSPQKIGRSPHLSATDRIRPGPPPQPSHLQPARSISMNQYIFSMYSIHCFSATERFNLSVAVSSPPSTEKSVGKISNF